jgi:acylphosphatase
MFVMDEAQLAREPRVFIPEAAGSSRSLATMVRRHIWVSGRVQGVWYRGSAAEQARVLGVSGWARNLPDGRVELVAEGEPGAVERFVEWCRKGPPAAVVTAVEVRQEDPEALRGFRVA